LNSTLVTFQAELANIHLGRIETQHHEELPRKPHQSQLDVPNGEQRADKVLQQARIPVADNQAGNLDRQLGTPQQIVNDDPQVTDAVVPPTNPFLERESLELELAVGSLIVLPLPTVEQKDREEAALLRRRTRTFLWIILAWEEHVAHPELYRV